MTSFIKVHMASLDKKRQIESFTETWVKTDTILALTSINEEGNPYQGTTFLKTGVHNKDNRIIGLYVCESPQEILDIIDSTENKQTYKFDLTHQQLPPPPPEIT